MHLRVYASTCACIHAHQPNCATRNPTSATSHPSLRAQVPHLKTQRRVRPARLRRAGMPAACASPRLPFAWPAYSVQCVDASALHPHTPCGSGPCRGRRPKCITLRPTYSPSHGVQAWATGLGGVSTSTSLRPPPRTSSNPPSAALRSACLSGWCSSAALRKAFFMSSPEAPRVNPKVLK
eukprot:365800-Chlamydomonas_euryale.AAC.7